MDDHDPHRWREEARIKREAGTDILAHMNARREADEARTRQLLDALTAGIEPEDNDDLKDA